MSSSGKRTAQEAFETGVSRVRKRHKKLMTTKKDRHNSGSEQVQQESVAREVAPVIQNGMTAIAAAQNTSLARTPVPEQVQDGGQSRTKNRRKRDKENTTAPQDGDTDKSENHENQADSASIPDRSKTKQRRVKNESSHEVVSASDLGHAQLKKKKKKKSSKKRGKGYQKGDGEGKENLIDPDQDVGTNYAGLGLEDRIEPAPTGGDAAVEINHDESETGSESGIDDLTGLLPLEDRIEAPPKKRKSKRTKGQSNMGRWSMSSTVGGYVLAQDPILTADDQNLILSTRSDVRIYSRSTSLLIRKMEPRLKGPDDAIISCALSKSNPAHLLIATSSGAISVWDWTQGGRIQRWKSHGELTNFVTLSSESDVEHVCRINRSPGQKELTVSISNLDAFSEYPVTDFEVLKRKHLQPYISVFEDTGVLIASTYSHLLIGYCPGFKTEDTSPPIFYWRELKLPSHLVSFDARSSVEHRAGNTPRVDIAAGTQCGEIILYEDLLFKLMGREKKNMNADISARVLHWHRHAVNSVKWSTDGNYLISGGRETVLVIWQLDTNNKQFLPHLTSEIQSISVSGKGSSYALRLGDNSVMVLSSANLDVITNIPGVAVPTDFQTHLAASLDPTSPDRLLVAVPRNAEQKNASAYALQTYDTNTGYELGRQALVRNATTVVTAGSKGNLNYEPDVTHVNISIDGKWLATVENWCADPDDIEGVTLNGEDDCEEYAAETCLKIWLYNEHSAGWELVNRIDNPHSRGSVKILALQSNYSKNEFATAGTDGKVKIWRPRARIRDGVPVRNEHGEQLYNWAAVSSVSCAVTSTGKKQIHYDSAALAYSRDGSVIAASWSHTDSTPGPRWTYLVNTDSAAVCHTAPNLCAQGPCSMVFVDRYLVLLSDSICIFDTVKASVLSQTKLGADYLGPRYLAANIIDGTVAIAVSPTRGKGPGRLAVIDINNLDRSPLFDKEVPARTRALLSSPAVQGYTIIDEYSNISHVRRLGRAARTAIHGAAEVRESEDVKRGLDGIFGQAQSQNQELAQIDVARNGGDTLLPNTTSDGNVPARTLEELLRFQSSSQTPGVSELFERVAGLFASPAVGA